MIGVQVTVICAEEQKLKRIEEKLRGLGCILAAGTVGAGNVLEVIKSGGADLVLVEGIPEFLELVKTVKEENLAPLLLLKNYQYLSFLGRIKESLGLHSVEEQETDAQWKTRIGVSIESFYRRQEIVWGEESINSEETTRSVVKKAKKVLAENLGVSETQALYTLQVLGHNRGVSLREISQKIIKCHQVNGESA